MPSIREHLHQRSLSRQDSRTDPSRLEDARRGVNELFSGRSTVGAQRIPESPKEANPQLGLHNMPSSTSIRIPYLSRTNSETNTPLASPRSSRARSIRTAFQPMRSRSDTVQSVSVGREERQGEGEIIAPPRVQRGLSGARRFVGVDPAELHLAELASSGRRRRRVKGKGGLGRGCAPKVKNKKIRAKILSCFISGLFLSLILTIYLALALSNRNESQEFHILLILIIIITTIFFCRSLIRLCLMIISPPTEQRPLPSMIGPGGYAEPVVPIRVNMVRDEEAAGMDSSEATKMPPPAYGLWRESVRMDPNRIYWQRNNAPMPDLESGRGLANVSEERSTTANRPPSYMSDDGIDYVIEATPRSTVPVEEVMPPHPSERNAWPRN